MGKEVAVITKGARNVMSIDINNINYGGAKTAIDKYLKSVGGGEGGKSAFPGDQIYFKKGQWFRGFGDKQASVKDGTRIVFNVPNMMAAWTKWEDVEGKTNKKGNQLRLPKYTPMTFPAAGDDPIERETLGDHDKSEWETNDDGSPADPWKPAVIYPVRSTKGDETIHHVHLATVSSVIPAFNLFRDVMAEMALHKGELPIIEIGSTKTSMDKTTQDKKGRKVTKKVTWDVPTFKVVGWVDAIDADNPGEGGIQVTTEGDGEMGEVETKKRIAGPKPSKVTKAEKDVLEGKTKKAAKPGKVSRKVVEADDNSI